MTAAYKLTLLASGLLLLIVVGSLFFRGDPSPDEQTAGGGEVAPDVADTSDDNALPDLYADRGTAPPPSPAADEDAGQTEAQAQKSPTRIHYSTDPIEPLPAAEPLDYPSLSQGRPPFAQRESIFASVDDLSPLDDGALAPATSADASAAMPEENEDQTPAASTDAQATGETGITPPQPTRLGLPYNATALGPIDQPQRLANPTDAPLTTGSLDDAGPTAAASGTPGRPSARLYTVEAGDSLSSIALTLYGSATKWVDIAQANPLVDPNRLKVGQELKLPDLGSAGEANAAATTEADDLPRRGARYTVQAGDSLSSVAKQFYNSASKWELIYQANRQAIGTDPGNVKVGTELLIPPPANGAN